MPDLRVGQTTDPAEVRRLMESVLVEAKAIGRHETATDTSSKWNGPKAVADAPNERDVLRHMHTVYMGGDQTVKGNYKLPHHKPGTDTAAVINGVNNALSRLPQTDDLGDAQAGAERHLRGHRRDAGLEEAMSEAEVRQAAREVAAADGLSESALLESVAASEGVSLTVERTLAETSGLVERADGGQTLVKIIAPGQGSSGEYPAEVLERDGPQVFRAGLHMYWDHPSMSEEAERPERSLRDLAAVLTEDARWDANGPSGPGLYAKAQVFAPFRDTLAEIGSHIGVSIRAAGSIERGDDGPVVTEITRALSADFVTQAGAGGEVVSLFEAARSHARTLTEQHGLSANEMRDALQQALADRFPGYELAFVLDYGEDWVVFELMPEDGMFRQYRMGYSVADGQVALAGQPVEVVTRYEYVPVDQTTPPDSGGENDAPQGLTPKEGPAMSESTDAPTDGAQTENDKTDTDQAVTEAAHEQKITSLQTQLSEVRTELARRDARDTVDRIVREATDLPEAARAKAAEDVDLQAEDLAEATRAALDAQRAYVAEVKQSLGVGRVSGMGSGQPNGQGPKTAEDYQALGLSEADAKAAARIHA